MSQPTVLLFDVDGTLVTTAGAGRRAIVRAMEQSGQRSCLDFSFAGMTDRAIVRRGLQNAGASPDEAAIDSVLDGYLELLREEVDAAELSKYRIHEGVLVALDAAARRPGCAVGLGTGNIEAGARIKLARVGIADRFAFGGFGSDAEDRGELIAVGAKRGAALLGRPLQQCRVVVIGDTPKDVAAARANQAEAFAVATGVFDKSQLASTEPDHLFVDLAAQGALQALLG